jgi:hypothetical protein
MTIHYTTTSTNSPSGAQTPKPERFWLVWVQPGADKPFGSGATNPTTTHTTRDSAEREAERLADANPGRVFYVVESLGWKQSTLTYVRGGGQYR